MGISIWQLLIIAAIVVLLFGTKKLRGMGSDIGAAVKGFKDSVSEGDKANEADEAEQAQEKLADKSQQADADFVESKKESEKK